jgi:hypothetical protein
MVAFNPEERRAFALAILTAAATAAATAGVNWVFAEAQRLVQARRDKGAASKAVSKEGDS